MEQASEKLKEMTYDAFTMIGIAALHEAFGCGDKRWQRWMDKFMEVADYLANGLATWEDYINEIKEQLNITLDIRWND